MEDKKVNGTIYDWALGIQGMLLVALWGNSNEEERKLIRPKIEELREKMKERIPVLLELNPDDEEIGELARDFRARD